MGVISKVFIAEPPQRKSGVGGASKEVGAPENRISGRSHVLTPWNKDLESSTRIETAPLTVRKYGDERA
jgi:hypothetical protein